jgi:nitronate monooxygenase
MSAPMAGVSGGLLAAHVCRAGGVGFIAAGHLQSTIPLDKEIAIFRTHAPSDAPLCIGFLGHSVFSSQDGWERYEHVLATHRPQVVQCSAPAIVKHNVTLAHQYNAKFLAQVGSYRDAVEAVHAGAHGLIAQGGEAGGHGLRREVGTATFPLASLLVNKFPDIPIIATGGIVNGRGVAAALALGCDGVSLGTRLWASTESIGNPALQAQLVKAESCDDVIRTTVFDTIQNVTSTVPWPEPFDSSGTLRNRTTSTWDGRMQELQEELANPDSQLLHDYHAACQQDDTNVVLVHAGQGVGEVSSIEPAYEIIKRVEDETKAALRRMKNVLIEQE